jgi:hypothetical protein
MNDDTTDLDQAEEDILTYSVSDEALEAAAGMMWGGAMSSAATAACPGCGSANPCC